MSSPSTHTALVIKKSKGILIRFPNEPSFQTPTRQNDQVIQLEYYKINTFVRLKPLPT